MEYYSVQHMCLSLVVENIAQNSTLQGILFLITNRVGTFDQAFRSRIHISLYYPVLQKVATIQIWKMHLART